MGETRWYRYRQSACLMSLCWCHSKNKWIHVVTGPSFSVCSAYIIVLFTVYFLQLFIMLHFSWAFCQCWGRFRELKNSGFGNKSTGCSFGEPKDFRYNNTTRLGLKKKAFTPSRCQVLTRKHDFSRWLLHWIIKIRQYKKTTTIGQF